jgi:hypothetical protein
MTCDFNLLTVISTGIATTVASSVSLLVASKNKRAQERAKLLDYIMQINQLAIQYPYFEEDSFCGSWHRNKCQTDERYQRYENFCCIVFNVLEDLWRHFKGNKCKMEDFFGVKEMIMRHSKWLHDSTAKKENVDGYNLSFIEFVDSYLK